MCLLILTQCISKKCDPLFSLRKMENFKHALGNHDFSPHLFCCAVSSALFVCPEVFEVLHPTIASRNARLCLLAGQPQEKHRDASTPEVDGWCRHIPTYQVASNEGYQHTKALRINKETKSNVERYIHY